MDRWNKVLSGWRVGFNSVYYPMVREEKWWACLTQENLQRECYRATEHPCPQVWMGFLALWINPTVAGHDACLGE